MARSVLGFVELNITRSDVDCFVRMCDVHWYHSGVRSTWQSFGLKYGGDVSSLPFYCKSG